MGLPDQQNFWNAISKAKSARFSPDWKEAVNALSRLAMFDMLPAIKAADRSDLERVLGEAFSMFSSFGSILLLSQGSQQDFYNATLAADVAFRRMMFAKTVVQGKEIIDFNIPEDQVNDGREFLGCTRLEEKGVWHEISSAMGKAETAIRTKATVTLDGISYLAGTCKTKDDITMKLPVVGDDECCGVIRLAWLFLTDERKMPGASFNSNKAAAQHYLRARRHICTGVLSVTQMNIFTTQYDEQKRRDIAAGNPNRMAGTANPVFPPDFAIRNWAYKGAVDGDVDRRRCNSDKSPPLWRAPNELFPTGSWEGGLGTDKE